MKKTIAILLAILILFTMSQAAFAAETDPIPEDELIEEYQNADAATVSITISSSGAATISVYCRGKAGTTKITATAYLERKNGSKWVRESINGASSVSFSSTSTTLSGSASCTVGSGTYRAVATFKITRSGSTETITVYSGNVSH